MKKNLKYFGKLLVVAVLLSACNPKEEEDNNDVSRVDQTANKNNNEAEIHYNAIDNIVSTQVSYHENKTENKVATNNLSEICATVNYTWDEKEAYIASMTIDFGEGCLHNGVTRSGKINIAKDGKFNQVGVKTTVTLENYKVNGFAVEGSLERNISEVSGNLLNGSIFYDVTVRDAKITAPNGNFFTWKSDRSSELKLPAFEVYVQGTAEGDDIFGNPFEVEIKEKLKLIPGCQHIVSGVLEIRPASLAPRTINYGNGSCDGKATLKVNNNSYTIDLQ